MFKVWRESTLLKNYMSTLALIAYAVIMQIFANSMISGINDANEAFAEFDAATD